jgi:hypothetical protein
VLIRTAIEDQLAGIVGKGAQLQTTRRAVEEGVVLQDFRRTTVSERRRALSECSDARNTGFDLNVARQGNSLLRPQRWAVGVLHGSNRGEALRADALTEEGPFELTTLLLGESDSGRRIEGAEEVFGLRIGL